MAQKLKAMANFDYTKIEIFLYEKIINIVKDSWETHKNIYHTYLKDVIFLKHKELRNWE